MLAVHFGPLVTVCWWFRRFVRPILFQALHDVPLTLDRQRAGCECPSAWLRLPMDLVTSVDGKTWEEMLSRIIAPVDFFCTACRYTSVHVMD